MNNYEDWAHLVAKKLKGEGDVIAAIDKDELDDSDAAEVFVRTVLKSFLPENYGIGAGRVVDAFGNRSDYMDVVIYNRSFPRIGMRGTQSDYLYESVLATFVIRAKYVRKTFFESMDACASMARLMTNVDKTVLVKLARRNGLKPGPNRTFIHEDPLRTARFELIGSPPAFMFGFSGIKNSYRQLQENIELWIEQRREQNSDVPMRAFPAVIATQGCFAWRNAAPLALSNREMMGVGNDEAPIRLIVLQLLYLLNRRLNVTTDGYGLKPNLSAYLSQFSAPNFERGIGDVDSLVNLRLAEGDSAAADQQKRLQPARDHTASAQNDTRSNPANSTTETADVSSKASVSKEPVAKVADEPAAKPAASPVKAAAAVAGAVFTSRPATDTKKSADAEPEGNSPGVFDKPSPFASAPAPAPAPVAKTDEAPAPATPWAPVAPLGSAPIPGMASSPDSDEPAAIPPVAPLGSAPIPGTASSPDSDEPAAKPPVAPLGSAPIPGTASSPDSDEPAAIPPVAPLGSAPIPGTASSPDSDEPAAIPPVAPLGSAPIPGTASSPDSDEPAAKPPVAPLGSAPIPGMASSPDSDEPAAKPPVAPLGSAPIPTRQAAPVVIPPRPAVDIEVTGEIPMPDSAGAKAEPDFESTIVVAPDPGTSTDAAGADAGKANEAVDFESTVVIAPDDTLSNKSTGNSTDAFIDRVKEQLSGSEQPAEDKDQDFVSTTPV